MTTTATGTEALRQEAAATVDAIADRLSDPDRVAAIGSAVPHGAEAASEPYPASWSSLGLSDSYSGVALLYAELTHTGDEPDRTYRALVHDYLSRAVNAPEGVRATGLGLHYDAPSLAFTATCAGTRTADFSRLGRQLDDLTAPGVERMIARVRSALHDSGTLHTWRDHDIITGLTGVGRLLLLRYGRHGGSRDALDAVLGLLTTVATAPDGTVDGTPITPWYAAEDQIGRWPKEPGVANLGIAHGIAGPLALMACAQRDGVSVPGMDEAADSVARLYFEHRMVDEYGPFWPDGLYVENGSVVSFPQRRRRDAWCYGAFGVARALHMAGKAFARPDWVDEATAAARGAVRSVEERSLVADFSLCHGWAGILHIVRCMAVDTDDPELASATGRLAAHVLEGFDPATPFGYQDKSIVPVEADRPGFLQGAAGIALALHGFATDRPSVTRWEAALMLD
ncbi:MULTISPECIES: lanthionine synthetase C family protein [unclassified Streptomyces]|uniref:lanthionine synthetase C family protein n=1 Tax=unclassified Streptomyces TaxID=2593676 RepID=UPI00336AA2DB